MVDESHKPGTGTHPCPRCGEILDVQHETTEFSEFIYCPNCRVKFTREREPIVEDDYEHEDGFRNLIKARQDKDEYEEFKCHTCSTDTLEKDYRVHEATTPKGEFTEVDNGISGFDECNLRCKCGRRHNGYLDVGEVVECECGRKYTLAVEFKEE